MQYKLIGWLMTLLLGLSWSIAFAQEQSSNQNASARSPLQVDADFSRFRADSTQSFIELHYGIQERMLTYKVDSGKLLGAVNMFLNIRRDTASVASREWSVPRIIADTGHISLGQTLIGLQSVGLPPGNYQATLVAYDVYAPERRDSLILPLSVKKFSEVVEQLSDVELCTSIKQSDEKNSLFYKNTLEVIPNASKMYGVGLPILYYYVEVYNLARSGESTPVVVRSSVLNSGGAELLSKQKAKPRSHNSTVEVGQMNISSLSGGSYRLRISLLDTTQSPVRVLAATEKKFFVYKPGSIPDTSRSTAAKEPEPPGNEYAFMKGKELDTAFQRLQYLATNPEVNQYKSLGDDNAKRNFLTQFWERRDPDPQTPINEMKQQYDRRIEHSNENYSTHFRDGWKTDRGRVYIVYGPPDEVERTSSSAETLPYEIWQYQGIQGGVIFVFVDRNGFGDYILVHSTHRNELRNENWMIEYAQKLR